MSIGHFRSQFDSEGHYRKGDGALDVIFATRGGVRYPGKLHFSKGLCVRAAMEGGGDWTQPDGSPIHGLQFLLDFGEKTLHHIAINDGCIVTLNDASGGSTKRDFLSNFSIARNLFIHPQVASDSPKVNTKKISRALARAAIWLTPKSVAGFNAPDFQELGPDRQADLKSAVNEFLSIAVQVPADKPATDEQYQSAAVAFKKMLDILGPYLPTSDEAKDVETALRSISRDFPDWVVNWDYELASDSEGLPAVWVSVFADEQCMPRAQVGRAASELTTKIRQAMTAYKIDRWPYIRMTTAQEHKSKVR